MTSRKAKAAKKPRGARLPAILLAALLAALLCCACADSGGMKDGFYTAEAAEFDEHGWKEYITIYVSAGNIVTVDYNAKNASGFIKSWDMSYMREMNITDGTYPNKYTREYAEALLFGQDPDSVAVIAGATHSHDSFQQLARAAMEQARAGNKNVVFVILEQELPVNE